MPKLKERKMTNDTTAFVTTWKIEKDGESITMPIYSINYSARYKINWGDGNESFGSSFLKHTYAKAGTYQVTVTLVTGKGLTINFDSRGLSYHSIPQKIISVDQWGTMKWESMSRAFKSCRNLRINAKDSPDLSQVTSMSYMFENTNFSADLTKWDVSNVKSMVYLFANSSFNGDISTWNVSNVTNMSVMFWEARSFSGDLSNWNVSKVTDMSSMFVGVEKFNSDISNWDVSNVTNMGGMFVRARSFKQDLSKWGTKLSKVTNMSTMFWNADKFNGNIGNWDVSNVTNMSRMFNNAKAFNVDISNWNVNNVVDMSGMFIGASSFNQNLNKWGTKLSKVTNMGRMFAATNFNQDLSNWDVSNVINMSGMFGATTAFNQDLNNWNVSNVTDMSRMFIGAKVFNQDLSNWGKKILKVTDMNYMFAETNAFNGNISNWNVSNVNNMRGMFRSASAFNQNIDAWDVSNVYDMDYMFYNASSFSKDLSNWNVSNVADMREMFGRLKLSQEAYDKLLTSWSKLKLRKDVWFGAGFSNYCKAGEARNILVNEFGWRISDKGQACTGLIDSNKSEILVIPNNVPIFNLRHFRLPNPLASRIIIQAKGTNNLPLTTGGEPLKIKTSFGQISKTIDHGDGTYSAMVFARQPGIAQISFIVGEQANSKSTQINFKELTGCEVNFNIQANKPILQTEGRYRPLIQNFKVRNPNINDPRNNIRSLREVSNLKGNWTTFTIKDPKKPITPKINVPGTYELQVRVKGKDDSWTEWYAFPQFTVNLCEPINSIAIQINKGECNTPIEYTDLVYVDKDKFKGTITDGLVFYSDFYLKIPYNGKNEHYITKPFSYGEGQYYNARSSDIVEERVNIQNIESVNTELEGEGMSIVIPESLIFNITKKGLVYNVHPCRGPER